MEPWMWAVFLKPFVALAFFLLAWVIAQLLRRYIPEGKIKRVLYSPPFWLRDKSGGS